MAACGGVVVVNGLTFQWLPLSTLLSAGLAEIRNKGWEEIWRDDALDNDPDWSRYQCMENENIMRFMAVIENGILVGYAAVLLISNIHDRKKMTSYVQDFYILPRRDRAMAIKALLDTVSSSLASLGAVEITASERSAIRQNRGGIGALFRRMGWQSHERLWTKTLIAKEA